MGGIKCQASLLRKVGVFVDIPPSPHVLLVNSHQQLISHDSYYCTTTVIIYYVILFALYVIVTSAVVVIKEYPNKHRLIFPNIPIHKINRYPRYYYCYCLLDSPIVRRSCSDNFAPWKDVRGPSTTSTACDTSNCGGIEAEVRAWVAIKTGKKLRYSLRKSFGQVWISKSLAFKRI